MRAIAGGSSQARPNRAEPRKVALLIFQYVAIGQGHAPGRTIHCQMTEGQPVVVTGGQPEGESVLPLPKRRLLLPVGGLMLA